MKNTIVSVVLLLTLSALSADAQTNFFTYQGSLKDGATAANGNYDFEFRVYDAATNGNAIGGLITITNRAVTNGVFSVDLNFLQGTFDGSDRYIEVRVRPAGGGAYVTLEPRQRINSVPYSLKSLTADTALNAASATNANSALTAVNATQLGGLAANQYVSSAAGNSAYIQNSASPQSTSASFNISGNGTVGGALRGNVVSATLWFNIGSNRALYADQFNASSFVGIEAGLNQGFDSVANSFFGYRAGSNTFAGSRNSFFGADAGRMNLVNENSFFGSGSGTANTLGTGNAFFGYQSGGQNIIGNDNTFVGSQAGQLNLGSSNSFFGRLAGSANVSGTNNSFYGQSAGRNSTGNSNSFFGAESGRENSTGQSNSFFGYQAGLNTTAGQLNTFVGRSAGAANQGAGSNSFFGANSGLNNTSGIQNMFAGVGAGILSTTGSRNTFIGASAGSTNTTGFDNTVLGFNAELGANNLSFATAIGAGAVATESNSVWLGRAEDIVYVPGFLRLAQLGGGGSTALCRNNANTIGPCSSSLRYKSNIGRYSSGLDLVRRLNPITFDWKDGGMHDLGLGAEDVAAIEPLLVTYNAKGEIEGVKYDRIGVVLINAVKDQQAQIEKLTEQNRKQQSTIESLVKAVCKKNSNDALCKELK